MIKILSINPGATSTKIGYFEDEKMIEKFELNYSLDQINQFENINNQKEMRLKDIEIELENAGFSVDSLDLIVGRGGILPPVEAGAYEVNSIMLERLKKNPILEHVSNLGAYLAKEVAKKYGKKNCPAYIYDPITIDQLSDVARISGTNLFERRSIAHMLNMRAVSIKISNEKLKKPYEDNNIIVAHIGGGSTVTVHNKGKIIDLVADDEGLFSTERAGGLPLKDVIDMCYQYKKEEVNTLLRKQGGLISYFGTNDARVVEEKAQAGDAKAQIVLDALAYQTAKSISQLAVVTYGDIDAIILTGGLVHSKMIREKIMNYVSFISPVYLVPGEAELQALANGALRAYLGKEPIHQYIDNGI